ncbi:MULTISPECIES: hypothetical protein [Citrobacter]|uniref:hypothetical protein n=1 Tax=Citrobacter TaxID=544 RepID=UPI000764856A|nr:MULTISPECIES: hypothetical protein [Citrobacter]KWZ91859.1 hypothetical protein HMPREF3212_01304 [Citrobacter freundii]MBJ9884523.1 hypothetical protein [Citrobacter sp. FDAARGOS_156]MDM2717493.1 hypothetical protein [Citrobacter sp. Cy232]
MSSLTFIGLSQLLSKKGELLQQNTHSLLERVSSAWNNKRDLNKQISIELNDGELEVSIPQLRFKCFTESKLSLHEGSLVGVITFYTSRDEKKQEFHKVYLDWDNCMHFGTPESTPSIDTDYAENVEYHFMNALIESASQNHLI